MAKSVKKGTRSGIQKKVPYKNKTKKFPRTHPRGGDHTPIKTTPPHHPFPVVAIGGSAGGLEAFSTLLEHLQPNLGMAYVYIQHLSPHHRSFLPEILQRKTKMKVVKVKNNMILKKDHVYIIPAKYIMSVTDGKLKLEVKKRITLLHPIDHFFSALAAIYRENAVGIILSGTGSDGSLGLMSIKTEGGVTFAQDDSAKYPDMPRNAIEMGYVDIVMPPKQIAGELNSLVKHPQAVSTLNEYLENHKTELQKIYTILHNKRGVDFSYYKQSMINRRIIRRMALNRVETISGYAKVLRENKDELDALYNDLLISVTSFFRDVVLFQAFEKKILPALLKGRKSNEPLRLWIPGCATGEEAMSYAIILLEQLGEKAVTTQIQIFATDLNAKAIERARKGIFAPPSMVNVSAQRLHRFFVKTDGQYQVIKIIREMCVFAPHNILKDPPFSNMDVISCQNVLIYLEAPTQYRIMQAFHYALKPEGYLLLGKSETVGAASDLFEHLDKQVKVYRKRKLTKPLQFDFPTRYFPRIEFPEKTDKPAATGKELDVEKITDKLLLSRYVPASVLVNKDLEILRFRGSASQYLSPASGKASLHLLKMVREELSFDLQSVIQRAKKENRPVSREGIMLVSNGTTQDISIEVLPVNGNAKDQYFLVLFRENKKEPLPEKSQPANTRSRNFMEKRISVLEDQLKEARYNISQITEDFEATREELQSSNEEVLSSNEELQSINEELETSREELQSTNEQLTTINDELLAKISELKVAGDYTRAIVETIHEALLILDDDLRIRGANKGFYQLFLVEPEETIDFFLFEVGHRQWNIPELRRLLKLVQNENRVISNYEVTHDFPGIGNRTVLLNAIKFPRVSEPGDLVILTIQDITSRKNMEEELKQKEERFRLLIQNASDIISVFDPAGKIVYQSPAIEPVLGYRVEERVGTNINLDPIVHPDDRKKKMDLLKRALTHPDKNVFGEFRLLHKDGSYRTVDANFRNMIDDPKINGIIANYRDITDRKVLEQQKDEFIGIASHELKTPVTSIKAYTQILEETFRKAKDIRSAEMLQKMNTQIDRLTTLIIDLLDFTRIEGGKLKFREEHYNLNALIKEIADEMQRTSQTHRIIKKLDKNIRIWGDRFRTGQVLTNLISNAIKYSPKSGKIVVSSVVKSGAVVIGIQDFGIGIEKNMLGKVFERFFRVSEPVLNTFPGLGLGLYIAAEIVRRQGGRIWVKSELGKGSTFYFSLPAGVKQTRK